MERIFSRILIKKTTLDFPRRTVLRPWRQSIRSASTAHGTSVILSIRAWSVRRRPGGFPAVLAAMLAFTLPAFPAAMFTLADVPMPGVANGSVVWGDFNNDSKPDVLVAGADGMFQGICQIWQNHSSGFFTNLNAALPGISSSAVAQSDLDNDGRVDLLLTGFAGVDERNFPIYLSQVWRNLGQGIFTNVQAGLPGVDAGAVALGDFDNDGKLDILLTGFSSTGAVAQVWRNLGHNRFTNINAGLPGVLYSSVAWGDFDGDERLDVLLTGTPDGFGNTAISQLWRNQGDGTFARIGADLPGVSQGAVAWGDFDQDGRLDILLTGFASTGAICQVWKNLGAGSFTNLHSALPGVYRSSVAVGDYDNDGNQDFALAGVGHDSTPICQVWRNTGSGGFENMDMGFPGVFSGSVTWADFDNDGRLDLLLTGFNNESIPTLQLYQNNTASSNAPALRISGFKILDNGARLLSFKGQIGFGYTVWGSTNLRQWTSLGAPNKGNPGAFQFNDPASVNLPSRFYRFTRP